MNQDQDETIDAPATEKQPLDLAVDIKKKGACQRHVTVTIPRADIDRYFTSQFDDLAPKAQVPGFRAGKAPRPVIEGKFRKQVTDQVKGALLMDSLAQLSDGKYFSAISEPDLAYDKVDVPAEGPMTFEFDIEVRPEFQVPNWKGMTLQRPEREITDAEIEARLEMIRRKNSDVVPVEGNVESGDVVTCNLRAYLNGKLVSSASEQAVGVRPILSFLDAKIEGFDKLVVGARAGETRKTQVNVSEFADDPELQGKSVDLEIEIVEVKRYDFIQESILLEKYFVGSLGELKDMLKATLGRQLAYEQHQAIRGQISRSLTEAATWELPPDLLRRQFRRELNRAMMELKSSGFSDDEIQARENSLRQDALRRTETFLKEHFILEKIAEEVGVEDSPEDYDFEIAKIAEASNDSERRVRARLERTGQMDALRNMIIERKVIALIEQNAVIKSVPATPFKANSETAINFAIGGSKSEDIPEAKYDDQQPAPIPGTAAAPAKT